MVTVKSVEGVTPTKLDSWTTKAPMNRARADFGTATVDGKIYAIGGSKPTIINEQYTVNRLLYSPNNPFHRRSAPNVQSIKYFF